MEAMKSNIDSKEQGAREKSRGNFRSAKRKVFWFDLGAKALVVLLISFLIGLADILFIRSKNGVWLPLTEKDIEIFIRIKAEYSLPFWWDFLFGVIWALLLYWLSQSSWFKKGTGPVMRKLLLALVIIGGFYFSVLYGGIFYGLIVSLSFLTLMIVITFAIWLGNFLLACTKIFFD